MPAERYGVALLAGDLGAVEYDGAGLRRDHAHQAFKRRALAGAVAAEQSDHLVLRDVERHVEQDVGIAVIGVEIFDLEQAHGAATPPR